MDLIGVEIAKMHGADIIHGDLTTSNMMLRHPFSFKSPQGAPIPTELVRRPFWHSGYCAQGITCHYWQVLVDFGLAYQSALVEDKAVDLYVLERAFSSTHPDSEPLFVSVLKAYEKQMGKGWLPIAKRLADGEKCYVHSQRPTLIPITAVRLRGRKRSMVG